MKFQNILVLYKSSAYERLQLESSRARAIPSRFKRAHQVHYATLAYVEKFLKAQKVAFKKIARGQAVDYRAFDFVITVGGDGTFLEAAKKVGTQAVLGVNSAPAWSVGRFCAATRENFTVIFDRVRKEKMPIRQLTRMSLQPSSGGVIEAVNDILVCHQNPAAMSHYLIKIGRKKEEHRSSGIWVATAAGSTGAIHSAGGEVQHVADVRLQYRTRELYLDCGVTHEFKSGFLGLKEKIELTSFMSEGIIYYDGAHDKIPFPFGESVTISRSLHPLQVVGL